MKRIRDLVAKKTTSRNRSEQEIAGYRDLLNTIHANYADIPFTTGLVLQFHRDLYQFIPRQEGKWKPKDNEITEIQSDGTKVVRFFSVPAHMTPDAMDMLHKQFAEFWQSTKIEPLLLISTYILDFLCIHPISYALPLKFCGFELSAMSSQLASTLRLVIFPFDLKIGTRYLYLMRKGVRPHLITLFINEVNNEQEKSNHNRCRGLRLMCRQLPSDEWL